MAAVDVGTRNIPPSDDLDELFDYDARDAFRDVDTNMDVPSRPKADAIADGMGLGIDEEIKVTKQRVPIPKLDENRLLGPAGIPKLRRITKERLKFKGKGNEYSDVARLLNIYQLWLDDLYPRAKFADGLAIIEKLGHTKRMQTMRREWINVGKPAESLENSESTSRVPVAKDPAKEATNDDTVEGAAAEDLERHTPPGEDQEFYSVTPQADRLKDATQPAVLIATQSLSESAAGNAEDDLLGDDLDALLAEDQLKQVAERAGPPLQGSGTQYREDNFDDEMEAMEGMEGMW